WASLHPRRPTIPACLPGMRSTESRHETPVPRRFPRPRADAGAGVRVALPVARAAAPWPPRPSRPWPQAPPPWPSPGAPRQRPPRRLVQALVSPRPARAGGVPAAALLRGLPRAPPAAAAPWLPLGAALRRRRGIPAGAGGHWPDHAGARLLIDRSTRFPHPSDEGSLARPLHGAVFFAPVPRACQPAFSAAPPISRRRGARRR